MSYALVLVSTSAVVAITIYSGLKAVEFVKEVEANNLTRCILDDFGFGK